MSKAEPQPELGNILDRWELMANDTKDYLRELEEEFCQGMDNLMRKMEQ